MEKKGKEERREQPNQKTNPPMKIRAENYTEKKKKETDIQNPRTNGKSKAIQTKSYKEAYTYTLTKREKGKKYMYLYILKRKSNQIKKQIYQ